MKLLIFGCNGQLGRDCISLLSREHNVTGFSRQQADISNQEQVNTLTLQYKPELIINCAAYTAVDKCETETELAWKTNSDGPRNLAQAAELIKARLFHISTDYVFDGRKDIPHAYTEDDPVSPLGQYGKSKLAGEEAVQKYCSSHLILRTAWLYSAHGHNFLKTMLRLTTKDCKKEIRVVNDQFGSLTWSFTLARQIKELLNTEMSGIAHATAEGYSTWYEAACYFLEKMNIPHNLKPCTTAQYPTPAQRPTNSILDNQSLKRAGYNLFQDWRKDVDCFVDQHGKRLTEEASAS